MKKTTPTDVLVESVNNLLPFCIESNSTIREKASSIANKIIESADESDLITLAKSLFEKNCELERLVATLGVRNHPDTLDTLTRDMNISGRIKNVLWCEGTHFVGQLVTMTEIDILKSPNLGRKSLKEIKDWLSRHNLHLGMSFPAWKRPI